MTEYLYRYWKAWGTEWFGESIIGLPESRQKVCIYLSKFPIISQTTKTYKIMGDDGRIRSVLKGDGKRYAHENKEWAWYSFQKRLTWERSILKSQLDLVIGAQSKTMNDIEAEYVELT